jgi:hypothetical protein
MAMMEALPLIAQILICFVLLVVFLILTVNLVEAVRQKCAARRRSQVVRRRSAKPLYVGSIPAAASSPRTGSDNEFATETPQTLSGKKKERRHAILFSLPLWLCVHAESLL